MIRDQQLQPLHINLNSTFTQVGDLRAGAKAIRSWELFYLRLAARIIGGEESGSKLNKPNCQVGRRGPGVAKLVNENNRGVP